MLLRRAFWRKFVHIPASAGAEEEEEGANWIRPGSLKCRWRVVVGQRATLKANQKT